MVLATPIGVGVGVDSSSSSKDASGPRGGFFDGVFESGLRKLADKVDTLGLGVDPEA